MDTQRLDRGPVLVCELGDEYVNSETLPPGVQMGKDEEQALYRAAREVTS